MIQTPRPLGLLICDQVLFEEGTGKPILVGCFGALRVKSFPAAPRFDVFATLTDGLGAGTITLTGSRLSNDEEIYRRSRQGTFNNPLAAYYVRFRVRSCTFPVASDYLFTLLADGEAIGERRLRVF